MLAKGFEASKWRSKGRPHAPKHFSGARKHVQVKPTALHRPGWAWCGSRSLSILPEGFPAASNHQEVTTRVDTAQEDTPSTHQAYSPKICQ